MGYFVYIIAAVFHALALLFAASMGVSIEQGDERDAKAKIWLALILFILGMLISVVAGYLMVLGAVS